MHVDHVGLRVEVIVPDAFQQHGARHHLAGMAHQVFEQPEFARLQVDRLPRALHLAAQQIELQVADAVAWSSCGGAVRRRSKRLDPRQQLGEGEGLGQIVVAAGPQALDPVVDLRRAPTGSAPGSRSARRASAWTRESPSSPGSMRSTMTRRRSRRSVRRNSPSRPLAAWSTT